jgi:hypothetical protein
MYGFDDFGGGDFGNFDIGGFGGKQQQQKGCLSRVFCCFNSFCKACITVLVLLAAGGCFFWYWCCCRGGSDSNVPQPGITTTGGSGGVQITGADGNISFINGLYLEPDDLAQLNDNCDMELDFPKKAMNRTVWDNIKGKKWLANNTLDCFLVFVDQTEEQFRPWIGWWILSTKSMHDSPEDPCPAPWRRRLMGRDGKVGKAWVIAKAGARSKTSTIFHAGKVPEEEWKLAGGRNRYRRNAQSLDITVKNKVAIEMDSLDTEWTCEL